MYLRRIHRLAAIAGVLWLAAGTAASAQGSYGRQQSKGYSVQGPGVLLGVVEPRMAKRYVPQEHYREHAWQSWEYTNYADGRYNRYVDQSLWGDTFYDVYGDFLTRGWMVYSWTEEHPRISESSSVFKPNGMSSLVIASDTKGGSSFSITIGEEIFTTLTPMTFRKAVFNGTQIDYSSDRLDLTGIFSRISAPGYFTDPNPVTFNEYTNLVGGRAAVHVSESVTVGAVLVGAHNGRGSVESMESNPLKGELTTHQLERGVADDAGFSSIVIRLSDDSPGDDIGGAVLLADEVEVYTRISERDTMMLGSEIGLLPDRRGGTFREGVRTADGVEQITLTYDLDQLTEILDDQDAVNQIRDLRFRLVLVNDYRVEVTSNAQTNAEDQPVYLLVTRAEGNVRDGTNKREVVFNYGIPTATRVIGFTLEARDLLGFNFYSELDFSHDYHQYPSKRRKTHEAHSGIRGDEGAHAWMTNLSRSTYPWYFYAEAFHIDENYNTSPFIVDGVGRVDYSDPTRSLYDFVDDNDDQDRKPDQERIFQDPRTAQERGSGGRQERGFADEAVFPGWDQNRDFISDFNQNSNFYLDNRYPDYEEPFLRYATDRPEYLFGIDLNNNGWVDQFENDDEPDYPYKRDHRGYNVYVRNHPVPGLQVTVGRAKERLISDDREATSSYLLGAFVRDWPQWGRVRVYNMTKTVEDDIQDNLVQWIQEPGLPGSHVSVSDPLFARDTWVNSFWLGYDRQTEWGVNFNHKFKWEVVRQSDKAEDDFGLEDARFLGLVNKVDYLHAFGRLSVRPKAKSEFLLDNTPYSMGGIVGEREEWTRLFFLTFSMPVLTRTTLEWGVEQMLFSDYVLDEDSLGRGDYTRDFRSSTAAVQLKNRSNFYGYRLTTLMGYSMRHTSRERIELGDKGETDSTVFMTIYASLAD